MFRELLEKMKSTKIVDIKMIKEGEESDRTINMLAKVIAQEIEDKYSSGDPIDRDIVEEYTIDYYAAITDAVIEMIKDRGKVEFIPESVDKIKKS